MHRSTPESRSPDGEAGAAVPAEAEQAQPDQLCRHRGWKEGERDEPSRRIQRCQRTSRGKAGGREGGEIGIEFLPTLLASAIIHPWGDHHH